jgi:hypothetical protein
MLNNNKFRRKCWWTPDICRKGLRKPWNASDHVSAEIRTEHLPITSLHRCIWSNQFCESYVRYQLCITSDLYGTDHIGSYRLVTELQHRSGGRYEGARHHTEPILSSSDKKHKQKSVNLNLFLTSGEESTLPPFYANTVHCN